MLPAWQPKVKDQNKATLKLEGACCHSNQAGRGMSPWQPSEKPVMTIESSQFDIFAAETRAAMSRAAMWVCQGGQWTMCHSTARWYDREVGGQCVTALKDGMTERSVGNVPQC